MKTKILPGSAATFFMWGLMFVALLTSLQLQAQTDQPLLSQLHTGNGKTAPAVNKFASPKLIYKLIDARNNTFGYDIYCNDHMMVHQSSVPALPGNQGFETRSDAAQVAQLVIRKIKRNAMPPTVTIEEMEKLNVIHNQKN